MRENRARQGNPENFEKQGAVPEPASYQKCCSFFFGWPQSGQPIL